jgi:electron transport complex protein RnfE
MGTGFCLALMLIGAIREVFGNGTLLGISIFGAGYNPALIMILPAGGFILIGYLVAGVKMYLNYKEKKLAERGEA